MKSQFFAVCVLVALIAVQGVVSTSQLEREADRAVQDWTKSIKNVVDTAIMVSTNIFGTEASRQCGMRISQQAALLSGSVNTAVKTCKLNSNEDEKFTCIISECNKGKSSCIDLSIKLLSC